MAKINGIDLDVLEKTKKMMTADPAAARKTNVIEGVWDPENARFTTEIEFNGRTHRLESDIPPFLGGKGERPGALHYCLFGSASCYIGTLVSVAAEEGIDLGAVRLRIANEVNFRKALGIAEEPIVEKVTITVEVENPDVDDATLGRLKAKADEQCPGMYCLTRPIPVETVVRRSR